MVDQEEATIESLVVADLGRGLSRAYLLEYIGGAFRFVAKAEGRSTTTQPYEEPVQGWNTLLKELEWATGRHLTSRDRLATPQLATGDGVDGLFVCASTTEPIRVAIVEAGQSPVTAEVLDAVRRVNARALHLAAPTHRKDGGWAAAQLDAVRAFSPEVAVLIVGANAQDALPRVHQLMKQVSMMEVVKRAIVIADGPAQEQGLANVGPRVKTSTISPLVRTPRDIGADIENELNATVTQRLAAGGYDAITEDALNAPISRVHAVNLVNRFISRAFSRGVVTLGIDDGVHVHLSTGGQDAMAAIPHVDLNAGITGLSGREVAEAQIWLPFESTEDELVTWVLNRSIRPWTLAETAKDMAIEQAMARQVLRRAVAEISRSQPMAMTHIDLIVGGPHLARWNSAGAAALTLLDAIDLVPSDGVIDLALDADGLMAVAGAIGTVSPELASSIFEYDTLLHLGSAIVIGGPQHDGDLACRGEIHYGGGEMLQFQIASGSLEVLPLRPGETATLVLRPERKYSIGGNPSGKTITLSDNRQVVGGAVGVIIDARARSLATGGNGRPAKVRQWLDSITGARPSPVRRFS